MIRISEHKAEINALVSEIESDSSLNLKVPTKLTKPHNLINSAQRDLAKKNPSPRYGFDKLMTTSSGVFSVYVSKELVGRALRFSDTFIKLIEKRGHSIEVRNEERIYNGVGTKLIIKDEIYDIDVRELRNRVIKDPESRWPSTELIPNGKLCLKINELYSYQWSDSKTIKLEDKLAQILAYLEIRTKCEIKEKMRIEAWHKEYRIKQEQKKALEEKRAEEINRFKSLLNQSSRWQKTEYLRNYLTELKKRPEAEKENFQKRLKWITDMIDWYDPFIEKEIEILKGIDRGSI